MTRACTVLLLWALLCFIVVGSSGSHVANAQAPVDPRVQSLAARNFGTVVLVEPHLGAGRRGLLARGTRLPILERRFGDDCAGAWTRVGVDAWVCSDDMEPSAAPPGGVPQPEVAPGELLPFRYAFAASDGTRAFARPSDYDTDDYVEAYGEGFGLAIVGHTIYQGVELARTRRGLWVEEESLRFAHGITLAGIELADGAPLDVAWVVKPHAQVRYAERGHGSRVLERFDVVHVVSVARGGWLSLTDGGRISARDVARPLVTEPPEGTGADDHWVDVDTTSQTLVAYVGHRPVFATLVSTGRALATHETPHGDHPIWIKLATQNMDDLERDDVSQNYSIESVPWVQFFEHSNGFHAAFWHDEFGRRHSHGCVNLTPRDARWLFDFTHPVMPPGWIAVLPTPNDRASVVHVR